VAATAVIAVMKIIPPEFLKVQAGRCRSLAENADRFTKERLLRLADDYDKRYEAAKGQKPEHPAIADGV
jgi:hypothetical protein